MFTPNEHWLTIGPAVAVFAGWVVILLAAAALAFTRRDS
jgi:ABC-type transport system involved in multi-copper enzyme maturation permease subunit